MEEKRVLVNVPLALRKMYPCDCKECIKIVGNECNHNGIDEDIIGPCEGKLKGWMISRPAYDWE